MVEETHRRLGVVMMDLLTLKSVPQSLAKDFGVAAPSRVGGHGVRLGKRWRKSGRASNDLDSSATVVSSARSSVDSITTSHETIPAASVPRTESRRSSHRTNAQGASSSLPLKSSPSRRTRPARISAASRTTSQWSVSSVDEEEVRLRATAMFDYEASSTTELTVSDRRRLLAMLAASIVRFVPPRLRRQRAICLDAQ